MCTTTILEVVHIIILYSLLYRSSSENITVFFLLLVST